MGNLLKIDRSVPFNPAEFLKPGWRIEEEDERSLALAEIDINTIRLEHMLKPGEISVRGEEKLRRLQEAGLRRLDAKILEALLANEHLIPEEWREKTNGVVTFIFFDGTVLRNPAGDRYVLAVSGYGGQWNWSYRWFGYGWRASDPSAVLTVGGDQ